MDKNKFLPQLLLPLILCLAWPEISIAGSAQGIQFYLNRNYIQAIETLEPEAKRGDAKAQYFLALAFRDGFMTDDSQYQAVVTRWLKKSAAQNYPPSLSELGIHYSQGHGVKENPNEAFQLFLAAAALGSVDGQYNLASSYLSGFGTAKIPDLAYRWFYRAAAKGDADSQFALGEMLRAGVGTNRNDRAAEYWYYQAAIQGHPEARPTLEEMRALGRDERLTILKQKVKKPRPPNQRSPVDIGGLANWHALQSPSDYTLEISAFDDKKSLSSFISNHQQLLPSQKYYYCLGPQNKKCTLTLGQFEVVANAQQLQEIVKTVSGDLSTKVVRFQDLYQQASRRKPMVTTDTAAIRVPDKHSSPDSDWILAQPSDSYTIQLVATKNRDSLIALKKDYQKNSKQPLSHLCSAQVCLLIYGSFSSVSDAKQVIASWPERLRKRGGWIRPFSGVQQQLRN